MARRDLQEVLDAVLDGVLVLGADGRVELVNDEACRILEVSAESAVGTVVEQLPGPGHALAKLARAVLRSGRAAIESERVAPRRLEGDLLVDVAASPLLEGGATPDGVVLALRDRTIHHELEREVSERERLSTFGRFAAGIAHEVKNPLAGIRGMAELLASRADDAKTRDAADLIVREAGRIAALVDDLMVFTRGDDLCLGEANIHRVLDDVLDLVSVERQAAQVQIERLYDPSIPDLSADADRLMQVFLNLARNALQAMEGKGTLRIETRMTLDRRLTRRNGVSVPTVRITVADDGPGIPTELLEKVATPLFTTRLSGTGLGLAVAKHWVARHDGSLRIESEPGAGTRVRVTLPLHQDSDPAAGGEMP